jgi:hypothetical protein
MNIRVVLLRFAFIRCCSLPKFGIARYDEGLCLLAGTLERTVLPFGVI